MLVDPRYLYSGLRSRQFTLALTANKVNPLIGANPGRVSLTVGAVSSAFNTIHLWPSNIVGSAAGFRIDTTHETLHFDYNTYPLLVASEWYAHPAAATISVNVIEVTFDAGLLQHAQQ